MEQIKPRGDAAWSREVDKTEVRADKDPKSGGRGHEAPDKEWAQGTKAPWEAKKPQGRGRGGPRAGRVRGRRCALPKIRPRLPVPQKAVAAP